MKAKEFLFRKWLLNNMDCPTYHDAFYSGFESAKYELISIMMSGPLDKISEKIKEFGDNEIESTDVENFNKNRNKEL